MRKNRRAVLVFAVVATLVVAFIALPALAGLYVDLRWYEELGHPDVLLTPFWTRLALGVCVGLIATAVLVGNLVLALRLSKSGRRPPLSFGDPARPVEVDIGRFVGKLAIPLGVLVGLVIGLAASASWQEWLLLVHGRAFGEADPIFGRDVSFYVFSLPFLESIYSWLFYSFFLALLASVAVYFLRGAVGPRTAPSRAPRIHLSALGAAIFLVLAYGAWLSSTKIVLSNTDLVAGAGYADVHATLPMIRAHLAVAVIGAVLLGISATRKRFILIAVAIGLYAVVGVVGRGIYPAIVQKYVVEPNELERERPFLRYEIQATRAAYGLERVNVRELSGDPSLSAQEIESHADTLDNVRVWDHGPLLDTFGQIQEIRTYYDFASVDNDRYVIGGQLRQTMLSARELATASLPNRTWINEHFTFTHGYGLTLGPVNEADAEGLPMLFVRDIPPATSVPEIRVRRPEIYYGELSESYVFVNTKNREFDHPSEQGNVYAAYRGRGGIRMSSALLRAALAIELGSFKTILSDDIRDESRVLMHRSVLERVSRLAPFLRFDRDPYLVVRSNGRLVWIIDAYTTSERYPYARRAGELTYMRNSVKAVLDAYDGTVTLYVMDAEDPILRTWRAIFPSLFTSMSRMPADVRAHLRYPLDIFHVQSQMLATYHMDSPELLYNREDQWEIPTLNRGRAGSEAMEPYYTIMRLPGEQRAEFILMLPFTPARKDNLAAWMVARNDNGALGELRVYEFPNDRLVYGPQQVLNRINQDPQISQQISLWDQRGSEAHFGNLLVIPIEQSLIYVLPLYLRSEGGRIPQLKRVVVVHENRIAMRETLDQALAEIFLRPAPSAPITTSAPPGQGAAEPAPVVAAPSEVASTDPRVAAMQHYERAVAAQRRGDWASYGEELNALERSLRELQPEASGGEPPPDPPVLRDTSLRPAPLGAREPSGGEPPPHPPVLRGTSLRSAPLGAREGTPR